MEERYESTKQRPDNLGQEWSTFRSVILSPKVLISLLAALVLVIVDSLIETIKPVGAMLTVLVAVFVGLSGSFMAIRWTEITQRGVAVVRGKSAIRGLALLVSNIASLRNRVAEYMKRLPEEDCDPELIRTYSEETEGRCSSLQLEVINSIEEWVDLIPEAEVRPKIAMISDLQAEVREKNQYIAELEQDLEKVKGESEEEKRIADELRERIRRAQEQLEESLEAMSQTKSSIDKSVLSGIADASIGYRDQEMLLVADTYAIPCSQCGRPRKPGDYTIGDGLCADCRSKRTTASD